MKKHIIAITAIILLSNPKIYTQEQSLAQKVKSSLQNIFKTQAQRLQEQEEQKRAEQEKQRINKTVEARTKACGTECKINEKCCVISTNGALPHTYCAEKCQKGSVPLQ